MTDPANDFEYKSDNEDIITEKEYSMLLLSSVHLFGHFLGP